MKSIFHVTLAAILISQALSAPLYMGNSDTHLSVASSKGGKNVELMLTIKAKQRTQLKMFSEALSPSEGTHSLTMKEDNIQVNPPMNDETLVWNSFHDGAYYLAFYHQFKGALDFLPLEMIIQDHVTELLLPTFSHPMLMVPQSSFYSCDQTLLSVHRADDGVHVSLFSDASKQSWKLDGDWKMKWRELDGDMTYGYGMRAQVHEPIKVFTDAQHFCEFQAQSLKQSEQILNPQKYYTFQNILNWAPKLKITKVQPQNEQL